MQRNWMTYTLMVGLHNGTASLENWQFLTKFNRKLPHDPIVVLLSVQNREMKIYFHTITCIHITHVPSSFYSFYSKTGTHAHIPQWVRGETNCCRQRESYSARNRSKLQIHETWRNLQRLLLSEKKGPKDDILYDPIIYHA